MTELETRHSCICFSPWLLIYSSSISQRMRSNVILAIHPTKSVIDYLRIACCLSYQHQVMCLEYLSSWTQIGHVFSHRGINPRQLSTSATKNDVCFAIKTLQIFGKSFIAFLMPPHQTKLNSYLMIMCFSWYNLRATLTPQCFLNAALGGPITFVPSISTHKYPNGNLLAINPCSTMSVISAFSIYRRWHSTTRIYDGLAQDDLILSWCAITHW